MPSENYRYYCLDSTGRPHNAAWFYAETDEDAIKHIEAKHPDSKCEIWLGKRLVATLSPKAQYARACRNVGASEEFDRRGPLLL